MKGFIKLFSAVAFVGALASCSEDLSLSNVDGVHSDADFVAFLPGSDNTTRVAVLEDFTYVWNDGDLVNVYSKEKSKFNVYELYDGAGTASGSFTRIKGEASMESLTDLYAVTESENLYGISATEDDEFLLTATIPASFNQENQDLAYWPLAVPFWGDASFDGQLSAKLNPLTAMLKIDIAGLPEGTRAIVINTHYYAYLNEGDAYWKENMLGGNDEALSGTFNAILKEGAALKVDERLTHADTLRVDIDQLTEKQDKVIFVPIVAQHYDKLTVLAVTEDSKTPYVWPNAEVLKVYEDFDGFTVGATRSIYQTAPIEFAGSTLKELSDFVADMVAGDGKHTVNVVATQDLVSDPENGDVLYIANNLPGQSSVNITFQGAVPTDFTVVEAPAVTHQLYNGTEPAGYEVTGWGEPTVSLPYTPSADKARTVTLNFGEVGVAAEDGIEILLPTSNVVLNAEYAPNATFTVLGANTKNVSGYTENANYNKREAGIVLKGSLGNVTIAEGHTGAIYAFGNGEDDEIKNLTILSEITNPLRITDMLIADIEYPNVGANGVAWIYTTGNAAIKTIQENNAYRRNRINLNASWTGKQLSEFALNRGYDQAEVFTAAQLQGLGLASKKGLGDSPYSQYAMSEVTRSVWLGGETFPWIGADVTNTFGEPIGSAFVFDGKNCNLRNMILSVDMPTLPIECCCGDNTVKVDDALGLIRRIHSTSTVDIKNVDLSDVLLETTLPIDNIGAITGDITADGAITLTRNAVANVRITAKGDNIGGAFGNVQSTAADITVKELIVDEGSEYPGKSWVASEGQNVGGAIGNVLCAETPDEYIGKFIVAVADKVDPDIVAGTIGIKVVAEYVTSLDDNVGGQIGNLGAKTIEYSKGTNIALNTTTINDKIYTKGSNVGGMVGQADYTDTENYILGTVEVTNEIQADKDAKKVKLNGVDPSGSNVGGLVGRQTIDEAYDKSKKTFVEGSVTAGTILAENQNAGGFIGFFEANKLQTATAERTAANYVEVGTLEATEGYVGGLVGMLSTSKEAYFGNTSTTDNSITVKVTTAINGAYAAGGLIGSNSDTNLNVRSKTGSKGTTYTINIANWNNTKGEEFFVTTDDRKLCGSFANVVGFLNNVLTINDKAITVTKGIISDNKKDELLFKLGNVSAPTVRVDSETGQGIYFWGDENGYVGVNNNSAAATGSYKLNGTALRGNVNYNIYKTY